MRVCVCARALFEGNLRLSGGSNGKKAPAKKKAQPKIDIVSETESSEEGACGYVGVDQEIISEIESSAIASRVCECVCVYGGGGGQSRRRRTSRHRMMNGCPRHRSAAAEPGMHAERALKRA